MSEVALALVLLVAASLLLKSFVRLQNVDPGFDPRNVLTMEVSLPLAKYARGKPVADFYADTIRRVEALPGVDAVALASILPLSGNNSDSSFAIEGRDPTQEKVPRRRVRSVTSGLFQVLKVYASQGRFLINGTRRRPEVTIVNQLREEMVPNLEAVGKKITFDDPRKPDPKWITIVGVVGDMRHRGLDVEAKPEYYLPHPQNAYRGMILATRSKQDPRSLAESIRREIRQLDPELPAANVRTLENIASDSIAPRAFRGLSAFCLVLSFSRPSHYGVMSSCWFSARMRSECALAVRQRADVLRLVVGHGMKLVVFGSVIGLIMALISTRALSAMLYRVGAFDPVTFAGVTVALALVALLASYIPALRATRADPMIALGHG